MTERSLTLREAVKVLRKHYGPPARLPTAEPFELILWDVPAGAPVRLRAS